MSEENKSAEQKDFEQTDASAPLNDAAEQQPVIVEQKEKETMEVHHHTHAKGKGFKHYLFEFFMLFLAVFCGFLAENQREHIVEHQREKTLMKSMLKDLAADTTFFGQMSRGISYYTSHIDSLIPLIKNNSDWNRSAKNIYQQQVWTYLYYKAVYSDRTIEQLKNSGNFRLLKNADVSDAIIQYDGYVRNFVINMQDEGVMEQWRRIDNCAAGIFKSVVFREWMKNWVPGTPFNHDVELPSSPYFLSTDKKLVDTYINLLDEYAVINSWFLQNVQLAITTAKGLDSLIKKEYHLK